MTLCKLATVFRDEALAEQNARTDPPNVTLRRGYPSGTFSHSLPTSDTPVQPDHPPHRYLPPKTPTPTARCA